MGQQKLGIIDSGVGGFSVVRELLRQDSSLDILYIGDQLYCPYGPKKPDFIRQRVAELVDYLLSQGAEAVAIACNSATIHAISFLRERYDIPIIGMEPGVKPAANQTKTGIIAVLATEASLSGEKFHRLIAEHGNRIRVITRPCPEMVDLVEAGELTGEKPRQILSRILAPLLEEKADQFVLGCTHFPFLKAIIADLLPHNCEIIDTSQAVVRHIREQLKTLEHANGSEIAKLWLFSSADEKQLQRQFGQLCPESTGSIVDCSSIT